MVGRRVLIPLIQVRVLVPEHLQKTPIKIAIKMGVFCFDPFFIIVKFHISLCKIRRQYNCSYPITPTCPVVKLKVCNTGMRVQQKGTPYNLFD